jgi:hypothetical protein
MMASEMPNMINATPTNSQKSNGEAVGGGGP